jgi:hypothetical protein
MAESIRIFFANRRGYFRQNFNWFGHITRNSVVHISISEARLEFHTPTFTHPATDLVRWLGDARMTVHNISPHDDGVTFSYTIDWSQPLNIEIDITVFEPVTEVWRDDINEFVRVR